MPPHGDVGPCIYPDTKAELIDVLIEAHHHAVMSREEFVAALERDRQRLEDVERARDKPCAQLLRENITSYEFIIKARQNHIDFIHNLVNQVQSTAECK